MANNKTPPAPTENQVKRHWDAQDTSVFQKPFTRDPGVTIVNTQAEVDRQLLAARDGEAVPAYRLRNTDDILADPLC